MTHDPWRDLLHDYRDGELAEPDRRAVAAHLEACRECRHELEAWERVASAFLKATPPASEGFVARVMAGIDEEGAEAPASGGWWLAPAFALATGFLLLLWSGSMSAPSAEMLLLADGSDWTFAQAAPGQDDVLADVLGERP